MEDDSQLNKETNDVAGDIIATFKAETKHLPVVVTEKLKDLRDLKESLGNVMEKLLQENNVLEKRSDLLEQKAYLVKTKVSQNQIVQAKLEKELAVCQKTLEAQKAKIESLEANQFQLGVNMVQSTSELVSKITQKHLEVKSTNCVRNGTQTLLFRIGECKTQIASLQSQIDAYKAKFPESTREVHKNENSA